MNASITSGGAQTYNAAVTLGGSTTLTSGSAVSFGSSVDGAQALSVSAGSATFAGAVGSGAALSSLTVTAGNIVLSDVTTTGAQTYNGSVVFNSNYNTNGGAFAVNGNTMLGGNSTVTTGSGAAAFSGTIDGAQSLTINSGSTNFGGTIGGAQPLAALSVTTAAAVQMPVTFVGTLSIVTTSGNITQLGAITASGTSNLQAGAGSITLELGNDFQQLVTAGGTGGITLNDVNVLFIGTINAGAGVTGGGVDLTANAFGANGGTITAGFANLTSNTNVSGLDVNMPGLPLRLFGNATLWQLTSPAAQPEVTRSSTNTSITYNGAIIQASVSQERASSVVGQASAGITAAIVDEANRTFGTDSVSEDVEYGFAGEIGATPPMDHRIDESGISLPGCVQESREGEPCK